MSKDKGPNFWDTKEGTLGMAVAILLAGGGLWGLYEILPFLVSFTTNALKFTLMVLVLASLFYGLVLDNSLRKFLGLRYKLLMKAMLYSLIERDPCEMLKLTQAAERERLDKINEAMGTANGALKVLEQTMTGYQKQAQQIVREYEELKKRQAPALDLQSRQFKIAQLNDAFTQIKAPFTKLSNIKAGFEEARKYTEVTLDRIDFQIGLETQKYKAMNSMTSVVNLFKGVLTGRDEMAQLQTATFEFMDEDYARKTGAIDQFLQDSRKIFDDANLQTSIMTSEGQAMLEDLDQRRLEVLGGSFDVKVQPVHVELVDQPMSTENKYTRYLK